MSESQIIERNEDMSPMGRLALLLQVDGDVIVAVRPDPRELHQTSVEFCQPGAGGGQSPATIRALRELAVAMREDNAQRPIITDPQRQLPPWDAKRYRDEKELRAEVERLRAACRAAQLVLKGTTAVNLVQQAAVNGAVVMLDEVMGGPEAKP